MILADTSIWIDHFRTANLKMHDLLTREQIAMHPFVAAELALGSLRNRTSTLLYLDLLPQVQVAQLSEVRHVIEAHALYSTGIGLADAHLVASCLLNPGTQLWTRDGRLERAARTLGILFKLR